MIYGSYKTGTDLMRADKHENATIKKPGKNPGFLILAPSSIRYPARQVNYIFSIITSPKPEQDT